MSPKSIGSTWHATKLIKHVDCLKGFPQNRENNKQAPQWIQNVCEKLNNI
jgi:hypothetical protein